MQNFTDNQNRKWAVEVNVSAIKRVRALTGTDLLQVIEGKLTDRLISDPVLLVDVLYAVCKPEADALNVSDEDFGRAMAGDAIDKATKALLEGIVSFCPSPKDRANLKQVLAATDRAVDKARDLIAARLGSGELDRIAEQAVRQAMSGG